MDYLQAVKDVLFLELGFTEEENNVNLDTKIIDDLGADSFDQIEICMKLEEIIDDDIDEDEFFKCITIGDLVNLIKREE